MKPKVPNFFLYDCAEYQGNIYFSTASMNGLFKMHDGNKLTFLGRFPNEDLWKEHLHRNVFEYEGKLFFVPMLGKNIAVYDIANSTFREIELDGIKDDLCFYAQAIRNGNEVMFIPGDLKYPFVLLNLDAGKVSAIDGLNKSIKKLTDIADMRFFLGYSAVYFDGNVYLSIPDTGKVVRITWKTWEVKQYILDTEIHLRSINEIDGMLYLNCKEPKLINWIPDGKMESISIQNQTDAKDYPYLKTIKAEDYLLLIPGHEDRFLKYNTETKIISEILLPEEFRRVDDKLLFIAYQYNNNKEIVFYPRSGNGMLVYHIESEEFDFVDLNKNVENKKELYAEWANQVLQETPIFEGTYDLSDFICAVDAKSDNRGAK